MTTSLAYHAEAAGRLPHVAPCAQTTLQRRAAALRWLPNAHAESPAAQQAQRPETAGRSQRVQCLDCISRRNPLGQWHDDRGPLAGWEVVAHDLNTARFYTGSNLRIGKTLTGGKRCIPNRGKGLEQVHAQRIAQDALFSMTVRRESA